MEDYGISINNDVVVRPHYYKYFHPKEVVVGGGIACESMLQILLDQNKNVITPVDLIDPKFKIEVSNCQLKPILQSFLFIDINFSLCTLTEQH